MPYSPEAYFEKNAIVLYVFYLHVVDILSSFIEIEWMFWSDLSPELCHAKFLNAL